MSSNNYRDTLNLPQTELPMRARLPQREPDVLAGWERLGLYRRIRESRWGCPRFVLHDGPIYANGSIHLGHAMNRVLKDIVVRSKTMNGFDAPYIPGWDCHGLPVELNVEKRLGKPGVDVPPAEFRAACRAYAQEQAQGQREDFIRLGISADWESGYLTMSASVEAATVRAFAQLWRNGYVYKGMKPVHWCGDCQSALAEAEVEYQDINSTAVYVRFRMDAQVVAAQLGQPLPALPLSVVIWTTTPWTLPANQAVVLNPKLAYQILQTPGDNPECLLVATTLAPELLQRLGLEVDQCTQLASSPGLALVGLVAQHPLHEREVPLLTADFVDDDTGTGAVHTAPAHGLDDYNLGLEHGLPCETEVTADCWFAPGTDPWSGASVAKASRIITGVMEDSGVLLAQEPFQHSYPHCWRHHSPLIFRATAQWFINLQEQNLRGRMMREIATVNWIPQRGRQTIEALVKNRPDWCISRQRTWGVPIPLFVHRETGEPHPETEALLEQIAKRMETGGIEAWHQLECEDVLDDGEQYQKQHHTLDVWFDSGVTHYSVPGVSGADLYLEGSDQHRGWFQSSLLTSVAISDSASVQSGADARLSG